MPRKNKTRLVISFIGDTDVNYITPTERDMSPILRLLQKLPGTRPIIAPYDTKLVLFVDDKPGETKRADFAADLEQLLPKMGLGDLQLEPIQIQLDRPTDLRGLYSQLGKFLPKIQVRSYDEVLFHLTSGTPHMTMTLVLYASTLPPSKVRLFQTSRYKDGVDLELQLPYILASREDTRATGGGGGKTLSDDARRDLIKDSVVEDMAAEDVYVGLHELATGRVRHSRALILGPAGSGKWHASRQLAKWRGKPEILLQEPGVVPGDDAILAEATLLVQRLDRWSAADMGALAALRDRRPDVFVAATFRTGQYTAARSAALTEGLPGAVHLELPPLHRRVDVIRLGEALARKAGISDGRLHTRLQHDWLADRFPRGLHDLETLVTTGALLSEGKHPDRESYRRVADALLSRDVLDEAWERLENLRFDPPHLTLEDVLNDFRVAAYTFGLTRCRSQPELAKLTGTPQSTISRTINGGYKGLPTTDGSNT